MGAELGPSYPSMEQGICLSSNVLTDSLGTDTMMVSYFLPAPSLKDDFLTTSKVFGNS